MRVMLQLLHAMVGIGSSILNRDPCNTRQEKSICEANKNVSSRRIELIGLYPFVVSVLK